MDKKTIVRMIVDTMVAVCFVYAGWSLREFRKLSESDIIQRTQIESINKTLGSFNASVGGLTKAINAQSHQIKSLILLATFRTDPWSGQMQVVLQESWFELMEKQGIVIKQSDRPDVRAIQRDFQGDLLPDELKEALNEH